MSDDYEEVSKFADRELDENGFKIVSTCMLVVCHGDEQFVTFVDY